METGSKAVEAPEPGKKLANACVLDFIAARRPTGITFAVFGVEDNDRRPPGPAFDFRESLLLTSIIF